MPLQSNSKRKLAVGFGLVLAFLLVNTAISLFNLYRVIDNNRSVAHTHEVLAELENTLSAMQDVESGQRGYVITGEEPYLEPYKAAVAGLQGHLKRLRVLIVAPSVRQHLPVLEREINERLAISTQAVILRRGQGFEAARRLIRTGRGKREMDKLRRTIALMKNTEDGLLRQRDAESQASTRRAFLTFALAALLNLGLLSLVHYMLRCDTAQRERVAVEVGQAKETAEAANHAKSTFLASMSHELRTPMNAITGMTGLLLHTNLTSEQRDYAQTVGSSADILLSIINDILDFSKIEAGKMDLERQPFNVRDCVESALDLVAQRAREKGLEIGALVELSTPDMVLGDVTRVRQILVNFLGNAVKFTHAGEIAIIADARPLENEKPGEEWYELHFAVRDTGIGISAAGMAGLFKSFSQADASTTRKYGGTGLGLAISKRLAEAMGGRVWVDSVEGEGSTFHCTLRVQATALVVASDAWQTDVELRTKRVLIVDDNATNRKILTLQVQPWGMEAVAVASGAEAMALIEQGERFDIAVLDMNMPEQDGLMLADAIRHVASAEGLPLIMLTSGGETAFDPRMEHFAAFLTKPVKASYLLDRFMEVLAPTTFNARALERDTAGHDELDATMGTTHPLRLLLAEDNAINQKVALSVLDRLGYTADVAHNGALALAAVQRQGYDVILMDVQMPEMDGLEATRQIRAALPLAMQPRIVAMTANAMQGDRDECLAAGMDDYVGKPFRPEDLVVALKKCRPLAVRKTLTAPPHDTAPLTTLVVQPATSPVTNLETPTEAAPEPIAARGLPAFDPAGLKQLQDILGQQAGALLPSLLDEFFEAAPTLIAAARAALQQQELTALRRAAHTLKSNSRDFGAVALGEVARVLETASKTVIPANAAELIGALDVEFARVKPELEVVQRGMLDANA